jgi:hypothetical protein
MPTFRDRVIGLERVPARELAPHAKNWRKHPANQRAALAGMLAEVGIAGAVIARRRSPAEGGGGAAVD